MPQFETTPIATWKDLPSFEDYKNRPREPKNDLGRTDFLQLLAAQLQYQDPLQPMTDSAFVAQLAQFSSLQQMENLNNTMTQYQYYNLAGKYIYAEVVINGVPSVVTGIVDRVMTLNGVTYVDVGGLTFEAKLVSEVWDRDLYADGNSLIANAGLVGKKVTGYEVVQDEDGNPVRREVSGVITMLSVDNGAMHAHVREASGKVTKVYVGSITSITDADAAPPSVEQPTDPPPYSNTPISPDEDESVAIEGDEAAPEDTGQIDAVEGDEAA